MILAILLMAAQADEVVVRIREPHSASPWTETSSATCGRQRLEMTRSMRPLETPPRVTINGRPVRGDVQALQQDLGEVRAAYRMSFRCGGDQDTLELIWFRGLADEHGQVHYRAGSAMFQGGALLESRSEEATEASFWYR
jgi:hypothetical protein